MAWTLLTGCLLLAGCESKLATIPTAYAFAGPSHLEVRSDLTLEAPVTAVLEHGQRVEIVDTRRRFVRIVTESGEQGWVDSTLLMTKAEIDSLDQLAASAHHRPPQGAGTVLDTLNVHTAPYRNAPTFMQLEAGDPMQVIAHRVTLRSDGAAPAAKTIPNRPVIDDSGLSFDDDEPLPPPMPHPPLLPHNWQSLSAPRLTDLPGYRDGRPRSAADDWLLIETADGQAGWVLLRMVFMSIPDDVGRYAEGNFIMSYLPLSEVYDAELGETKRNWLWATASRSLQPYDFDSFRVFMWSTRRHRYETAYIQRNIKGHFPVEPVELEDDDDPAFAVLVEDSEGQLQRRVYAFNGTRVRSISSEPVEAPAPVPDVRLSASFDVMQMPADELSWMDRLRRTTKGWFEPKQE